MLCIVLLQFEVHIIEFCNHHKNDPEAEFSDDDDDDDNHNNDDKIKKDVNELKKKTTISEWDKTFIQQFSVHDGTLFDIITAANILDIPILIHTLCKSIIYLIKGKSSQEIRDIFKLSELLDQTPDNHSPSSPIDVKNK
ncbi:unnamed protein product [Adineta steineri]|uniref:SKP1 component dimerisation domain-containing protein n=1 Tax=Adineta steineri TaxID=433720 RepID=A0A814ITW1_9BILA|nr:unnamed protein product [Adineta steineri]